MYKLPFSSSGGNRRGRTAQRARERREARFERMREQNKNGKGNGVNTDDWYAETLRRLRQERGEQ